MPNGSLGSIVWCLWLRHVDDGAGHGADEDHTARRFSLHKVLGDSACPIVCAIEIYTHELVQSIWRVSDGVEVFREAGRGDEMVDLSVSTDDFREGGIHRIWVRHITAVRGDFGFSEPSCQFGGIQKRALMQHAYSSTPGFSAMKWPTMASACR